MSTNSLALASMTFHWLSLNQSKSAGGEPQTSTKLSRNRTNCRLWRMRSSSAKLAGSSGFVTNALWPPLRRKMSPSKGRFSMDASSSRIWVGVGTSQPYSMSFLPGGVVGAAPANSDTAKTAHKIRAVTQGRRCSSGCPTAGRHLALDAAPGRRNGREIGFMLDH